MVKTHHNTYYMRVHAHYELSKQVSYCTSMNSKLLTIRFIFNNTPNIINVFFVYMTVTRVSYLNTSSTCQLLWSYIGR